MQHYACGFLFSLDRQQVVLIRKNRPAWQAGKLNGVGGKVEVGETALSAMVREFREEAGVSVDTWQQVLELRGLDWAGHFFRAFGDVDAVRSITDEALEIHSVTSLPTDTIANLRWMVPLLLDEDVIGKAYDVALMTTEQ